MFQVGQKIKTCADLYYEKQIINKISQIIAIENFLSCIQHNFGLFKNYFDTSSSYWCLCSSNQITEFSSVTNSMCIFLGLSITLLSWNILTDAWFSYKISPKLDY